MFQGIYTCFLKTPLYSGKVQGGEKMEKTYIQKYLHEIRLDFMGPTGHRLELNTFKVNILR